MPHTSNLWGGSPVVPFLKADGWPTEGARLFPIPAVSLPTGFHLRQQLLTASVEISLRYRLLDFGCDGFGVRWHSPALGQTPKDKWNGDPHRWTFAKGPHV